MEEELRAKKIIEGVEKYLNDNARNLKFKTGENPMEGIAPYNKQGPTGWKTLEDGTRVRTTENEHIWPDKHAEEVLRDDAGKTWWTSKDRQESYTYQVAALVSYFKTHGNAYIQGDNQATRDFRKLKSEFDEGKIELEEFISEAVPLIGLEASYRRFLAARDAAGDESISDAKGFLAAIGAETQLHVAGARRPKDDMGREIGPSQIEDGLSKFSPDQLREWVEGDHTGTGINEQRPVEAGENPQSPDGRKFDDVWLSEEQALQRIEARKKREREEREREERERERLLERERGRLMEMVRQDQEWVQSQSGRDPRLEAIEVVTVTANERPEVIQRLVKETELGDDPRLTQQLGPPPAPPYQDPYVPPPDPPYQDPYVSPPDPPYQDPYVSPPDPPYQDPYVSPQYRSKDDE
jgi:hypothetical protein